jgi:plasmid stabilization system protein ParE
VLTLRHSPLFEEKLDVLLDIIIADKPQSALSFLNELEKKGEVICENPMLYRVSHYADDETIRDLIFKGYTIPYKIDLDDESIILLSIFKGENPKTVRQILS